MHQPREPTRRRIVYYGGAGDVVGTFRHWLADCSDPTQIAKTYSGQFFDVCRDLGYPGEAVSEHPRLDSEQRGSIRVRHTGARRKLRGVLYHLDAWGQALSRSFAAAIRGTGVLVICRPQHVLPYILAHWMGVRIVIAMHETLWPVLKRPTRMQRLLHRLDAPLYRRAAGVMCVSEACTRQVLSAAPDARVFPFRPSYDPQTFTALPGPANSAGTFHVTFVGRIEVNKGVLDFVEVARLLESRCPGRFHYHVCGVGSAEVQLRSAISSKHLERRFTLHGYCERDRLLEVFAVSHCVVVPTTSKFTEGFNKVVAEGALAGRPVVTSFSCPSAIELEDVIVPVNADSADEYAQVVLMLASDAKYYATCCERTSRFGSFLFEYRNSWAAALRRALGDADCISTGITAPQSMTAAGMAGGGAERASG